MMFLHILLFLFVASGLKATPLPSPYTEPPPDPYNPNIDYYTTEKPETASGLGLFFLLNLKIQHNIFNIFNFDSDYSNYDYNYNNDNNDDLIISVFAGFEKTSENLLEAFVRKSQAILNPDENFNDGLLEHLFGHRKAKLILNTKEQFRNDQLKEFLRGNKLEKLLEQNDETEKGKSLI